jgi:hypothetical protein
MDASKSTDTYRIFILGESAAQGDPEPAYGAWRYLEMLLRERFPGQRFEVVNVAVTAINSHVILSIARECAQYQGDLWIVYMGNNEMVGPFGAATVFGTRAPPWWSVRMNLGAQQTRVGQLLTALTRKSEDKSAGSSWRGMQMFLEHQLAPDDPRREVIYRNFQKNLNDILDAGLNSGAKIVLNTVAVNLKDCPPFASLSNSNLPAGDRAAYGELVRRFQGSVYAMALTRVHDPLEAQELAQEVGAAPSRAGDVEDLQQDRPAVRTGIGLVEGGDDRLAFGLESERDLRYTGCSHRASSCVRLDTSRHRIYSTSARFGGPSLSSFANFPG